MPASRTVMTSPDGVTWSVQANPAFDSYGANALSVTESDGVIVIGGGVAYANPPHRIARSTDGVTFSPITSPVDGGAAGTYCVRYISTVGLFVAANGSISPSTLQSADGITWVDTAGEDEDGQSPPQAFAGQGSDAFQIAQIGNGPHVPTKAGPNVPPITWTNNPEPDYAGFESYGLSAIGAPDGSLYSSFLAGSDLGPSVVVAYVWDGTSWTNTYVGPLAPIGPNVNQPLATGHNGGTVYLAVIPDYNSALGPTASGGTVLSATSLNGPWSAIGTVPGLAASAPFNPLDLAYGNGGTWVLVSTGYDIQICDQAYSPFIAAPSAAVLTSTDDGVTWTQQTTPFDGQQLNGVCWSDTLGLFIAVGYLPTFRGGWTIGDVNWSGSGWAVGTTP